MTFNEMAVACTGERSCACGNEPSGSIKFGRFLTRSRTCHSVSQFVATEDFCIILAVKFLVLKEKNV
jgi:hypothetical protein